MKNKKGRYIVKKIENREQGGEYDQRGHLSISYDVQFENKEGYEHIAEFVFMKDAVAFKKLMNLKLSEKGLYLWSLR